MRPTIKIIKERFPFQSIKGAEIGVWEGENALDILNMLPNIECLYLVDPYEAYKDYSKNDSPTSPAEDLTIKLNEARLKSMHNLQPFTNKIIWIYKKFDRGQIIEPLDFIYIDGNHEYEYVKQDIVLATQLVKKGGVIGGHDIGSLGIDRAIKEYCERKNITWYVGKNEAVLSEVNGKPLQQGWDWWFINV